MMLFILFSTNDELHNLKGETEQNKNIHRLKKIFTIFSFTDKNECIIAGSS